VRAAVRSALLLEHGAKAEGDGWGYVGVAGVDRLLVGVGYAGIRCTGNYRTLKLTDVAVLGPAWFAAH
jgi:hypothetical protein